MINLNIFPVIGNVENLIVDISFSPEVPLFPGMDNQRRNLLCLQLLTIKISRVNSLYHEIVADISIQVTFPDRGLDDNSGHNFLYQDPLASITLNIIGLHPKDGRMIDTEFDNTFVSDCRLGVVVYVRQCWVG